MTDLIDLEYDLALTDPAARPARFRALAAEHGSIAASRPTRKRNRQ